MLLLATSRESSGLIGERVECRVGHVVAGCAQTARVALLRPPARRKPRRFVARLRERKICVDADVFAVAEVGRRDGVGLRGIAPC